MKTIGSVLDTITYFVAAVAGISLFIAGIGVMNVMYISVTERTEEIAIRRAFGAKGRDIEIQFLVESVVLCLIGGIIGLILGIIIATLIDLVTPEMVKFRQSRFRHPSCRCININRYHFRLDTRTFSF